MSFEQSLRKTDAKGVKIKLGDGDVWLFQKPKVGIAPRVTSHLGDISEFSFDRTKAKVLHSERYNELLDAYLEAKPEDELDATLACALELLRPNYADIDDLIPELFPKYFEDEENDSMWEAVKSVVMGRSPKPIPVG